MTWQILYIYISAYPALFEGLTNLHGCILDPSIFTHYHGWPEEIIVLKRGSPMKIIIRDAYQQSTRSHETQDWLPIHDPEIKGKQCLLHSFKCPLYFLGQWQIKIDNYMQEWLDHGTDQTTVYPPPKPPLQ